MDSTEKINNLNVMIQGKLAAMTDPHQMKKYALSTAESLVESNAKFFERPKIPIPDNLSWLVRKSLISAIVYGEELSISEIKGEDDDVARVLEDKKHRDKLKCIDSGYIVLDVEKTSGICNSTFIVLKQEHYVRGQALQMMLGLVKEEDRSPRGLTLQRFVTLKLAVSILFGCPLYKVKYVPKRSK
jgi:hypothetical protein